MKSFPRLAVLFAALALVPGARQSRAEEPVPAHLGDKLIIESSTAPVFLGKATLTVTPLHHHAGVYSGNYQMQVSPLSLASEKGDISVTVPDDAVRKISQMTAVSFQGQATNTSGKQRTIDGRATPTAADHGNLTLKIISERGKLVFHTTYRFASN